jgi:hypothetical protein
MYAFQHLCERKLSTGSKIPVHNTGTRQYSLKGSAHIPVPKKFCQAEHFLSTNRYDITAVESDAQMVPVLQQFNQASLYRYRSRNVF